MAALTGMECETEQGTAIRADTAPTAFGDSRRWRDRNLLLKAGAARNTAVENVALAHTFAEAIVTFWSDLHAKNAFRESNKAGVLVLNSGSGRLGWYLMSAIGEKLAAADISGIEPCFILTDASDADIDYCRDHPKMAASRHKGTIVFASWNAESEAIPHAVAQAMGSMNSVPVVVIAVFCFSAFRQELYYANYGRLYEVMVDDERTEDAAGPPGASETEFACLPFSLNGNVDFSAMKPARRALAEYYRDFISDAYCYLPIGAVTCLETLKKTFKAGAMVLAADFGWSTDRELRGVNDPQIPSDILQPIPVNFHAIEKYAENADGRAVFSRQSAGGLITGAIFLGMKTFEKSLFHRIGRIVASTNAESAATCVQAMISRGNPVASDQALALIRANGADPLAFFGMLPHIRSDQFGIDYEERLLRIALLEKIAALFYPVAGDVEVAFQLGVYAMELGDWGTAIDLFELQLKLFGDEPSTLYNLALCLLQVGEYEKCAVALDQIPPNEDGDENGRKLREDACRRIKKMREFPWYDDTAFRENDLRLVPMSAFHAEAMWYQLYDPSIGVMTRLPEFKSKEDVAAWIEEQEKIKNHMVFAVMHERKGFAGCAALDWHGNLGHFYFWIGADYQNHGYGKRAAKLLIDNARTRLGIERIFTSAYRDNTRSIRALLKIGFVELPFRAKEPDEELLFFKYDKNNGSNGVFNELQTILSAIQSTIKLCSRTYGNAYENAAMKRLPKKKGYYHGNRRT